MIEREQLQDRKDSTDSIERYIDGLTGGYIKRLKGFPKSKLLQIRGKYPFIAYLLRIQSADERVTAEKDKFNKRFTDFIEDYIRYLPPHSDKSEFVGVFTRIVCVNAGINLIVAANQTFDDFPYFRNPLIQSARDVFLYGARVSKDYGEEIDQNWLNEFILDVVMQSVERWKTDRRKEFPGRIAQFRNPPLILP